MLILALETTADVCSVAVSGDSGVLAARGFPHRMQLSQGLLSEVESVLSTAGTTFDELQGFAVGIGPGSFTGVRVGVMTVKMWARMLNKPVCGIGSLNAVAHELAGATDGLVVPLIRARPGLVYAQPFRSGIEPLEDASVDEPAALVDRLAARTPDDYIFCGPGLAEARDKLEEAARGQMKPVFAETEGPRAESIAAIALERFKAGSADDPLSLLPLYIQPPAIRTKPGPV